MKERRKRLKGHVISDKMDKTVVVSVETTTRHPRYGKVLRVRKKYKVHDEQNESCVGDQVVIVESRPLSREKRWRVEEIINRAEELPEIAEEAVEVLP